jgi:hypothetical protein
MKQTVKNILKTIDTIPAVVKTLSDNEKTEFFANLRARSIAVDVRIDFDLASEAWNKHTGADNPRKLKRKQAEWRRSVRTRRSPQRLVNNGLIRSNRKRRKPSRFSPQPFN